MTAKFHRGSRWELLCPVLYLVEDGNSVFRICEVRLTPVNYDFTLGMDPGQGAERLA
jgi:hypothetical protein